MTPAELWSKPWTPELSDPETLIRRAPIRSLRDSARGSRRSRRPVCLPSYRTARQRTNPRRHVQPRTRKTLFPRSRSPSSRSLEQIRTLESSSGDSVASSYSELGLVPSPAAFASSLDQVTAGMSATSKSSSPRLIRATGSRPSAMRRFLELPALPRSMSSPTTISSRLSTRCLPRPLFRCRISSPVPQMMDLTSLTQASEPNPTRRPQRRKSRRSRSSVGSSSAAPAPRAPLLAPRPQRWLECASAHPRSLPQSFGTRPGSRSSQPSSARRSSTGSWWPARSGSRTRSRPS